MGSIVSIVYKPQHIDFLSSSKYARLPLHTARLVEGYGIDGDRKGGNPQRQLNIMAQETLRDLYYEGFCVEPGEMGEQIIVSGIDIERLLPGDRIVLGTALVEVTEQRTPCQRFERIQHMPASSAKGRLGVMARVITGGYISIGNAAALWQPTAETSEEYV